MKFLGKIEGSWGFLKGRSLEGLGIRGRRKGRWWRGRQRPERPKDKGKSSSRLFRKKRWWICLWRRMMRRWRGGKRSRGNYIGRNWKNRFSFNGKRSKCKRRRWILGECFTIQPFQLNLLKKLSNLPNSLHSQIQVQVQFWMRESKVSKVWKTDTKKDLWVWMRCKKP